MTKLSAEILAYYKSDRFQPVLPRYPHWRHFRFKDEDKKWCKVYRQVRTVAQLKQLILEKGGQDIYFTTSCFLNPKKVGPRKRRRGYAVDSLILSNDLVLDFDPKGIDIESMDIARLETLDAVSVLGTPNRVYFTGRGFRLDYDQPFYRCDRILDDFAGDRYEFYAKNRKLFIKGLPKKYSTLDTQITENPLCVVRVDGTANSKTGYICTEITVDLLRLPVIEILQHIPYVTKERPVIPLKKENDELPRRSITGDVERPGQSSLTTYYLESTVKGVKGRHVLLMKISDKLDRKKIKKLSNRYGLGDIFRLEINKDRWLVCLTTFQWRRMEKIMKAFRAMNGVEMSRFRMSKMPVYDGIKVKSLIRNTQWNSRFVSAGHLSLMQTLGNVDLTRYPNVHGTPGEVMIGRTKR